MLRRVRDGLAAMLLGGFVLLEPPIASDSSAKWSADTTKPLHQWSFVSAFDTAAACETKRIDRQANVAADLGVDAESDQPGTKLGAVFDARRRSRCVADTEYFPEKAPSK